MTPNFLEKDLFIFRVDRCTSRMSLRVINCLRQVFVSRREVEKSRSENKTLVEMTIKCMLFFV